MKVLKQKLSMSLLRKMTSTLIASWIILWALSSSPVSQYVQANLIPNGTNVCSRKESFSQAYMVSLKKSVNKQVSFKCRPQSQWPIFYKICYRNSVVYQVGYKQLYKVAYRVVYSCCSGWKATGNACTEPICFQDCHNGTCVKPNTCACLPGYHGAACDQPCQSNKWGPGCTNTCQCKNNATCDIRNGSCSCLPGWQGEACDQPCKQGYYGNDCAQICTCQNGATCDHVTGSCSCSSGWQGQHCNISCSLGHYGNKCQQTCQCHNKAKCNHVTGACLCSRGYQGTFCEKPCPSGFYGDGCQEKCQCQHGSCDHVSGACTCRTGYMGTRCTEPCPSDSYGLNCSLSCSCSQNARCDPIDGSCICKEGFSSGESCDQTCQPGHYGKRCQNKCNCYSDESCDPVDGNCTCKYENCSERPKASKDKSSDATNGPLVPAIITVVVILIVISIAIVCLVHQKRRNQRMRNETKNDEPVYKFAEQNITRAANDKQEDYYKLQTRNSKPTYMGLTGTSRTTSQSNVNSIGIRNPAYQKLIKGDHSNDVGYVAMETQYAGLDSHKKTDSVYQPLQKESLIQSKNDEANSCSGRAYQSLNRPTSYHDKCNPAYEFAELPEHYDNLPPACGEILRKDNSYTDEKENFYLGLLSDENQPNTSARSDQPTYEILPPTRNDNSPAIYGNL